MIYCNFIVDAHRIFHFGLISPHCAPGQDTAEHSRMIEAFRTFQHVFMRLVWQCDSASSPCASAGLLLLLHFCTRPRGPGWPCGDRARAARAHSQPRLHDLRRGCWREGKRPAVHEARRWRRSHCGRRIFFKKDRWSAIPYFSHFFSRSPS